MTEYNIREYGVEPDIYCPDCGQGGITFPSGETILAKTLILQCHVCGANLWRVILPRK